MNRLRCSVGCWHRRQRHCHRRHLDLFVLIVVPTSFADTNKMSSEKVAIFFVLQKFPSLERGLEMKFTPYIALSVALFARCGLGTDVDAGSTPEDACVGLDENDPCAVQSPLM